MNVFKMLKVALSNYKQNLRVCLLYGTLIPIGMALFTAVPGILSLTGLDFILLNILSTPLSFVSTFLSASVSTLPVLIALTKPSADGPYTFKERFSSKFTPFTLLTTLYILTGVAVMIFLAIFVFIYALVTIITEALLAYYIVLFILIPVILFVSFITETALIFAYITLVTENIKVSSAFGRGYKMLFKNFWRSMGHSFFFSVIVLIIPMFFAVLSAIFSQNLFVANVLSTQDTVLSVIFSVLTVISAIIVRPIFTSCMVETYRKNWLKEHNIPLTPEAEDEVFETPDDETIYL